MDAARQDYLKRRPPSREPHMSMKPRGLHAHVRLAWPIQNFQPRSGRRLCQSVACWYLSAISTSAVSLHAGPTN